MRTSLIIFLGVIASTVSSAATDKDDLVREVRHEVLLVPGYTVFDWLAYRIDNGKVTLVTEQRFCPPFDAQPFAADCFMASYRSYVGLKFGRFSTISIPLQSSGPGASSLHPLDGKAPEPAPRNKRF